MGCAFCVPFLIDSAGSLDDLQEPGSYITGNYLGEPFVITRDENNELHAFYNVCRHHGAQLLKVCV